ncbi:glutamyl-tRNA reductase [Acidiferrobacter sp.]|jgi:glutamyl-tRNA reductase|uniref:glutamyl-tRNA reductase n=1 Tax=Acidiferrobacter sp. TaxID=1872107 RepID=UPI00262E3866|nr:glutamyl-tRNA reductase [Acidiferrobacter sp.]
MHLVALGINHKTAPVALREQAAFDPQALPDALRAVTEAGAGEATILSTCNRTELYCGLDGASDETLIDWFCQYHKLTPRAVRPYLYVHDGRTAVAHAFRVASGLDSLVLGEPQILGQMKTAFAAAHKAGTTGKLLNHLFQHTFSVAKQVRTDTAIGANAVSVAYAAVSLARRIFDNLSHQTVLLIGAGEMIELAARHLKEQGIRRMIVANRTVERASSLGNIYGAEAVSLIELPDYLAAADIVISCTASLLPLLGKGAVESALKTRKHRPMFLVDLAVPRDIEPEVGELPDVYLYTIDDLKGVIEENMESRQAAARQAETIIEGQVIEFMRWVRSLDSVPTVRALRAAAEALRDAELERARRALERGEPAEQVLLRFAHSLTNKFMHGPSTTLRDPKTDGDLDLVGATRALFRLDDKAS